MYPTPHPSTPHATQVTPARPLTLCWDPRLTTQACLTTTTTTTVEGVVALGEWGTRGAHQLILVIVAQVMADYWTQTHLLHHLLKSLQIRSLMEDPQNLCLLLSQMTHVLPQEGEWVQCVSEDVRHFMTVMQI